MEYQTKSKQNETFGSVIFLTNVIQRTWSGRQAINKEAARQGVRLPPGRALYRRGSTDLLLPPIYTYVPPNYQIQSQNPNSTAVTSCIREIPSWGLFRSSAGGGIDHKGPLHQLHGLSGDVWVV